MSRERSAASSAQFHVHRTHRPQCSAAEHIDCIARCRGSSGTHPSRGRSDRRIRLAHVYVRNRWQTFSISNEVRRPRARRIKQINGQRLHIQFPVQANFPRTNSPPKLHHFTPDRYRTQFADPSPHDDTMHIHVAHPNRLSMMVSILHPKARASTIASSDLPVIWPV